MGQRTKVSCFPPNKEITEVLKVGLKTSAMVNDRGRDAAVRFTAAAFLPFSQGNNSLKNRLNT